jgi:hypothetical protein
MSEQELTDIKTALHNARVNWDVANAQDNLSKIAILNEPIEALESAITIITTLEARVSELDNAEDLLRIIRSEEDSYEAAEIVLARILLNVNKYFE